MATPLIQVQQISKSFGGARALVDVTMEIRRGEVLAVCGENGAGKSTLIKVLAGSHAPDTGQVLVDGEPLTFGVHASEAAGIAVIHQESVAFPHLTAAENIFVGREPRRLAGLLLDRDRMQQQSQELLRQLGEDVEIKRPVGELPMAQRQMVGMARALSQQCRLLIMDEPTASLSARETKVLFRIIRQLKSQGVSVLYVSHRMEEIFDLADRVTVLRDGQHVGTEEIGNVTSESLIRMMVGREVQSTTRHASLAGAPQGPALLEVEGLSREGEFEDISFNVHAGEIVGLAGLVGAGRSEVAEAIFGARSYDRGSVRVGETPLPPNSVAASIKAGLGLVPEDRQYLGLVLPLSVGANLTLAVLRSLGRWTIRRTGRERQLVTQLMMDLNVRAAGPDLPAETLSGGNQQKLVIGKWLASQPRVLILDEPTRGVDVGAKAEIHRLIRKLTDEGMGTLIISSEMPELLATCDRILVMRQGRLAGQVLSNNATQERILAMSLPDVAESAPESAGVA